MLTVFQSWRSEAHRDEARSLLEEFSSTDVRRNHILYHKRLATERASLTNAFLLITHVHNALILQSLGNNIAAANWVGR